MRKNLRVSFDLDRLVCHDEGDGWGSAEPYMWTIFFKIDGDTCKLNDSLMLEGTATVFTTPGSHGNLGDTDVDAGDTVSVPPAIGQQDMTLIPIPVPDFVKQAGTDDVSAFAGCIVVLMEEDNVSDAGAEAGHAALNAAVQNAFDSIIPTLGALNKDISDDVINNLISQVQSKVTDAIKNQQNAFENLWSWINPDDTIGTVVWKFSGDDLLKQTPLQLQKRWQNEGDWELFGSVATEELPTCPADVVKKIFEEIFGQGSSSSTMQALYNFRNQEMAKFGGLGFWWKIAQRNSLFLKQALNNKDVRDAAVSLFKHAPELLKNRDQPIAESHFNAGVEILKHILEISRKNRSARKDISRSLDALQILKGKSPAEIFDSLSQVKPARFPSVHTLGSNFKLKIKSNSKKTDRRKES